MIIKNSQIKDWKDLQRKVKELFSEMDYETDESKKVDLAGRGKKEIDVYIKDNLASINQTYLVECKFWNEKVPQEIVHAFKTVMEETGANTGFIISKKGFQKGSYEATRYTNIHLFTFEELQHKYGNEWLRKKTIKLETVIKELRQIHHMHFDQFNKLPVFNNMFFYNEEHSKKLSFYHQLITNLSITNIPKSYIYSNSLTISFNPLWEYEDNFRFNDGYEYNFKNLRDFFDKMTLGAKKCLNGFNTLHKEANQYFESLDEKVQDKLISNMFMNFVEEQPIYSLKNHFDKKEYSNIIERAINGMSNKKLCTTRGHKTLRG